MEKLVDEFLNSLVTELAKLSIDEIVKLEQKVKNFISEVQQKYNEEKMKKMTKK